LGDHLPKREISLIIGPRQAGKTTLMLLLKDYLENKGEKTTFLSLDFEREAGYVFIDEIQRRENAGLFLKGLYDLIYPISLSSQVPGAWS